tara:strand:- start:886 stop:1593 length:708 start_codon:yes stop_codon:yes gene_type:complete
MRYLVLENKFAQLTINSIKQNMPDAEYKVVPVVGGRIATALKNSTDLTMVVMGGIVLNIKEGDLPPEESLRKHHLAMSRQAVFSDHPKWKHNYKLIRSHLTDGTVDMSIFIINPKKWRSVPETDSNFLLGRKILYMPRYMNHRDDPTLGTCMGANNIIQYAALGQDSSVLNYLTHLYSGKAEVRETFGCCFDLLLPYVEGLGEPERKIVEKLGNTTKLRIGRLRQMLVDIKKAPD